MEPDGRSFIVDASVLIAYYQASDSLHEEAVRLLNEVGEANLIIHPLIVHEVITLLTYRHGFSAVQPFVDAVLNGNNILVPSSDTRAEVRRFKEIGKKISLADAALISLAHATGMPLLTFDRQMLSLYAK